MKIIVIADHSFDKPETEKSIIEPLDRTLASQITFTDRSGVGRWPVIRQCPRPGGRLCHYFDVEVHSDVQFGDHGTGIYWRKRGRGHTPRVAIADVAQRLAVFRG